MTIDDKDLLNSILASLNRVDHIKPDAIPDIDLYMDQVTTFMENNLAPAKRYPDDKVLTKTMINNYTKNDLLPPPVKKKYSKEHVLLLIFIYYFKGILSINDIQMLLAPLVERFFDQDQDFSLEDIYNEVFGLEKGYVERMKQDVAEKFTHSSETFQDAPTEDQAFLQQFSFICMLSFDVYVKKLLIEKMIDGMREPNRSAEQPTDKKATDKKASDKKAADRKEKDK